jgi:hypothetical protein
MTRGHDSRLLLIPALPYEVCRPQFFAQYLAQQIQNGWLLEIFFAVKI